MTEPSAGPGGDRATGARRTGNGAGNANANGKSTVTGPITQPMPPSSSGREPGSFVADVRALPGRVSVRLRLTLLYGLLFFFAGALLLFITYLLVAQILDQVFPPGLQIRRPDGYTIPTEVLKSRTMNELIGRSMLVLAGTGVMALVLGYFVADRALAPLQRVTTTARRLSESTLHERIALEGPADEIKELADTFDAMLERLGHAFDSQSRFVANASHELRTPLAINRTLLEVALGDPEASEDLKAVGRTLLANNARHERLIEGLLLLARSERELSNRTSVDLTEVAGTVLETQGKRADEAGVVVRTELSSGRTQGDPVLLEHLVSNLVDNAIKHNVEDGGTVWVRTGVLDGFATVQVENTGPGVPAYEVDRLFEPFRRLHEDRVESAKGAGLGLSIVRSVVRAHRGTVYATPRQGGGLVVTVRLPLTS
ncbi:sensor histidine kinase [Thermomonospora umbrina]|uniref:histidine kinase n=1 Tax=Thermomonospora umbrina TaxID=111806 RepID=A0A3D9SI21_9ACTN|nr:HAMP domain-containing sensor histidine kinase [Thermomonospora umbrina]REE95337.1 signal transduction histidine kinase [Thermomonospora umbrina]